MGKYPWSVGRIHGYYVIFAVLQWISVVVRVNTSTLDSSPTYKMTLVFPSFPYTLYVCTRFEQAPEACTMLSGLSLLCSARNLAIENCAGYFGSPQSMFRKWVFSWRQSFSGVFFFYLLVFSFIFNDFSTRHFSISLFRRRRDFTSGRQLYSD